MKATPKKQIIKKSTLTIRMEGNEVTLIEELKKDTGEKSATKALFHAANFYLNDRPQLQERIEELRNIRDTQAEKLEETEQFFNIFRKRIAIKK